MRLYSRILEKKLRKDSFKGKSLIIVGSRQVGKTTLIKEVLKGFKDTKAKTLNCDNREDLELLEGKNLEFLENIISNSKILFIDEAHKVSNIGQTLKILVDHYGKKLQIFVTASSSFNLLHKTQEPLTGRKFVYNLYPLSTEEIYPDKNFLRLKKELEQLLIFGSYPEITKQKSFEEKKQLLREITTSYLYKDILEFQQVKNPNLVNRLLKALALQVGQEVSYTELSNLLGVDKNTVERYIDLLEKCFVVFRLSPYTQNKRKELSRLRKVYFYDLGIRNTIINNFNFIDMRDDIGKLFENFVIVERLKYREYHQVYSDQYFWRTYDGSEVDLIEEQGGKLFGYEIKWREKKWSKKPERWLEYKNSSYETVTKDNLYKFIF
ncbi:MAG: ATP-binding protein [Candidatus Melainabacteria bacterium]|nr:ATP-binding protein [Candidatus Melainabacteria bacterium]